MKAAVQKPKVLVVILFLLPLMLIACGRKSVDGDGSDGASASLNLSGTSAVTADFLQNCTSHGGSIINSNNIELCKYAGTPTSLQSSNSFFSFQSQSSTQWITTSVFISPGDTLKLTKGGSAALASIGGYNTFSISGNHVSLRNESGYLSIGITVPAGFSSVGLNISNLVVERCIDTNNTPYQCP